MARTMGESGGNERLVLMGGTEVQHEAKVMVAE